MRIINASETGTLALGFQGEDQRLEIRFPLVDEKTGRNITEEFPGGSFSISIMLPGDPAEHIVGSEDFRIEGNWLIWTVKEAYTVGFGEGKLQLNYAFGGMAKSRIWKTNVRKSINSGSGTVPSWSDWKTELLNAAAAVQNAVESYDEMTATAEELPAGSTPTAEMDHTGDHPVLKLGIPASQGGGGDVQSVNGKTGVVELNANDVGALPASTPIPPAVTVDSALSNTSTNPVQNKVIAGALSSQSETIVQLTGAVDDLSDDVDDIISGTIERTETINVSFANENAGYINTSGQLVGETTTMYKHTDQFQLIAGDVITINAKGYKQGATILSILAKVDDNSYTSLVDTQDGSATETVVYTATQDCACVISYDNRETHNATIVRNTTIDLAHRYSNPAHFVKRVGDVVYIKSHYNDTEDIVVELAAAGGNGLPNPQKIYTVNKANTKMDNSTAPSRYLLNRYTDWFSPHQVKAVNNADGSEPNTAIFTGGNHTGTGGAKTADCTQFDVLVDGVLIESGESAYGTAITINITNEICGWNTWKSDGTGRKILKEEIRIAIGENAKWHCEIVQTALEDIQRLRYYGLQCVIDYYTAGIQYLGGSNRALNAYNADSDSGDKNCRDGRMLTANGDIMLTHTDPLDLGSFDYGVNANYSYFATAAATKAYYNLINNSGTYETVFNQGNGEITSCRGWYDWVFSAPVEATQ